MKNKFVVIILSSLLVLLIFLGVYFGFVRKSNSNENTKKPNQGEVLNETSLDKVLVVYFSATGSTERVAKEISNELNADIFEIVPVIKYTSSDLSYNNSNSRVSKEHNDESLRKIELEKVKVDNWENYDTIFIGYPIWWGIAAWPMNTFVNANDFTGKTVIPFCTSASSGPGESVELLYKETNTGEWLEVKRFSSSVSLDEVEIWMDNLKEKK